MSQKPTFITSTTSTTFSFQNHIFRTTSTTLSFQCHFMPSQLPRFRSHATFYIILRQSVQPRLPRLALESFQSLQNSSHLGQGPTTLYHALKKNSFLATTTTTSCSGVISQPPELITSCSRTHPTLPRFQKIIHYWPPKLPRLAPGPFMNQNNSSHLAPGPTTLYHTFKKVFHLATTSTTSYSQKNNSSHFAPRPTTLYHAFKKNIHLATTTTTSYS